MNSTKQILLILLMSLTSLGILTAQDFYDLNTVQTIEITFAQSNWDQLLDAENAGNDGYIMAQSVSLNGIVYDSVGVKYKGNSTYNPNQTKNPFHIELDTYKEQDHQGYKDIKLSNVAKDPSFLREVLSYQILRQYMVAPLSNYANVYVNGTLIGLYSNSESITKRFVNDRFDSKNNAFFKCNPPAGAGPQSNDFPNLVYLGQDSTDYYDGYEMKSDIGWQELIDLCDTLVNNTESIEEMLNVDAALWMLAYDNALVNLDSYIGAFAQNYYLYRDEYGIFNPVVWDLNESFGRFSMTGSGSLNSTAAKQQMNPLLNINDADFPLVRELLNIPTYQKRYLAHFKTILLENFDNDKYYQDATTLRTLIDADVLADNNKFFTYQNFQDNLDNDVTGAPGPGGGGTVGIANLMDGRNSYLLGTSNFSNTQPTITNINGATPNPIIDQAFTFSVDIADATTAYLAYRTKAGAPFTNLELFDDGAHDDGAANDGVFANELSMSTANIQYYIYAENNDAGRFAPERAAFEYYYLTATISNPTAGDLVINEFMAANETTQADQDGEYDDWIELYNNTASAIDLSGFSLSDDADDLLQWSFPDGTTIAGSDYLIIWADNDDLQTGLHANFKLSSTAESIFLVNAAGEIADEVSYADQADDISYGRFPNGTGAFQVMSPTFSAENMGTVGVFNAAEKLTNFKLFPNPTAENFTVQLDSGNYSISVFDMKGLLFFEKEITGNTEINTQQWPDGIYAVKVGNTVARLLVH